MKLKMKLTQLLSGVVISLCSLTLSAQGIDASLYTFDFLPDGSFPIENRAMHLSRLGFKGVTFRIAKQEDLDKLKGYLSTSEVKSGSLSIPVVFFPISIQADGSWNQLWKQTLELSPSTSLWAIIKDTEHATEEKVVSVLKEMCVEAQKSGTDVVIYPHDNNLIESAEEAIPYIEKVGMPNLYLSLHLCHEMRAGNGDRLLDVAIKAAPHLKYASISGTDYTMQPLEKGDWSDAIKPLDEGDFPVEDFVLALQKINFSSKMFLHTYGIKQDPRDHLSRSMAKWNEMVETTGKELATNLDLILDNPENACWDEASETWFISSLGGEKVTLEEDGYGWITRLDKNREVISNRWVDGLDAPTGMAAHKGKLYVGDRGILVEIDISKGEIIRKIPLPGSEFINDVAVSPKGEVYISDTFGNRIYRMNKQGKAEVFLESSGLDYPNGLWVDGGDLIVATWGNIIDRETFETSKKGTLLKVDLKSKEIRPVGKGEPIANIDGVVKYGDFFYVTDWTGGRLLQVSEKGDVIEVVCGFNQFADLGIDTKSGIVVIPEMSKNRYITVNLNALGNP